MAVALQKPVEVYCFTGKTAAGKSVLAERLSKHLDLPTFQLGIRLNNLAAKFGFKDLFEWYFKEPETFLQQQEKLTASAIKIAEKHRGIIFHGTFSKSVYDTLTNEFGENNVFVIHVSAPEQLRVRRFWAQVNHTRKHEGLPDLSYSDIRRRLKQYEDWKVKLGVRELLRVPGVIRIQNSKTPHSAFSELKEMIRYVRVFSGIAPPEKGFKRMVWAATRWAKPSYWKWKMRRKPKKTYRPI